MIVVQECHLSVLDPVSTQGTFTWELKCLTLLILTCQTKYDIKSKLLNDHPQELFGYNI